MKVLLLAPRPTFSLLLTKQVTTDVIVVRLLSGLFAFN